MPRLLRVLLTGVAFFLFSAAGAVVGYCVMPLAWVTGRDRDDRIRRAHGAFYRCARMYIRFMGWMDLFRLPLVPELQRTVRERTPCVVVANHPALLDILWLVSLLPGVAFLARAEWFRSPFIAPILLMGDHIPGPRSAEPADGAITLEHMLDRLRRGRSVVIFPEGTRSPAHGLGSFHRGAFEAAMRAQVPLVLLAITVEPPSLLKGQRWYHVPPSRMEVGLWVVDVVDPGTFTGSVRQLRAYARDRYLAALGLAPAVKTTTPVG